MQTNLGYLVVGEAGDGRSAVNLAREVRPDIVIMDVKMPDMVGIEAARLLREVSIAPDLVKPFRESDLTPAIEVVLARFSEFRALEREVASLSDALETRKLVDRAKGILMDTQGLNENDAFRRIQKMSMNNRKSMRSVAEAIILAHQVSEQ